MISVQTLHTGAEFQQLAGEWRRLLEASRADCLFLTWEWLFTWWRHLGAGRPLQIVTLREGRDLIAVAPLMLRRPQPHRLLPFRALEFLGSGNAGSDYLDVIAVREREAPALAALADYLGRRKLVLELARVSARTAVVTQLAATLGRQHWSNEPRAGDVCPYIRLADHSWDSFLAGLGSAHRYNVRRRLRNLSKAFGDPQLLQAETPEQCSDWLAQMIGLHQKRRASLEPSTAFNAPALVNFHREFAALALQRGWLRLQLLCLAGKPAAALYGFRYRDVFYFYQSGFDPALHQYSLGLATIALSIKGAIAEGASEFDLLHGDEAYKFLWTHEVRELQRFNLFPPGVRGRLWQHASRMRTGLKRLVHRTAPRSGSAEPATAQGAGCRLESD